MVTLKSQDLNRRGFTEMSENSQVVLALDGEKTGFVRKSRSLTDITNRYENSSMEKHRGEDEKMGILLRKCGKLGKMQHESCENVGSETEEAAILSQSSTCRGENSHKRKDEGCIHSVCENISGNGKPPLDNNGGHWYSLGAKRLHHLSKVDGVSASLNATDEVLSDGMVSHVSQLTNHDPLPSIRCKSRFSFLPEEKDREEVERDQNYIFKEQLDHSCDDNSQFMEGQVNGEEDDASLMRLDETSRSEGISSSLLDSIQQMEKEHSGFDLDGGIDLNKSCSCSFCLKAAYMWSDLYYQDARGRLTALKKSRKQVKSLGGRFYNHGDLNGNNLKSVGNGREYSGKSVGLESNLMHQWRSLFLHTEDALVNESSQLQSSLYKLKELRRNCKSDLERLYGVSLEKP